MLKILFVCTGNTCRSPIAASLLQAELAAAALPFTVEAFSAGLDAPEGAPAAEPAITLLRARGVNDLERHRAVKLNKNMVAEADLIFVMTADQHHHLLNLFPEAEGKTYLLTDYASNGRDKGDIADPFGGGLKKYQMSLEEIHNCIKKIMLKLKGGQQHEAGSGQ